jgi:predicted hydrocarbon binding protein
MQGVVFTSLTEMLEEVAGIEKLQLILDTAALKDDAFVSTDVYEDSDLFQVVGAASETLDIPVRTLVTDFGKYLFVTLSAKHPRLSADFPDFKSFLLGIESVIHVEVSKLYPSSSLPIFDYENPGENELVMLYRSPRKLCHLAEGLIAGAAEAFKASYTLEHPLCMHNGETHCRLEIKILE